ncbi:MAG: hypothetical protein U0169_13990 [Polyangiaceae bacterium]
MTRTNAATFALLLATSAPAACEHLACSKSAHPSPSAPVSVPVPDIKLPSPPPLPSLDPALVSRDQGRIEGLQAWNGGVYVHSRPPRFLDGTLDEARPASDLFDSLGPPFAASTVLGVATRASGPVALLRTKDSGLAVLAKESAGWARLPLPGTVAASRDVPFWIAAEGTSVVLVEPTAIHESEGGAFVSRPIGPSPEPWVLGKRAPRHVRAWKGRVFFGYARGEWGGALHSLDRTTLTWRDETIDPEDDGASRTIPVTGLDVDDRGRLWVTRGLAHLGIHDGDLSVRERDTWTTLARSPGMSGRGRTGDGPSRALGWSLPASSFDGLATDGEGCLVASGNVGLVRRAGDGTWRTILPWNFLYADGVVVVAGKIVVGTFDAGLVVVDERAGTVRRVTLPATP